MTKRWTTSNKATYNIGYHLIWCPKYRKPVLVNEVKKRLRQLLIQKAKEIEVSIETMEILPEHLHLFVKSSPVDSPHFIVRQFKGFSSRILRKEFKHLTTRLPTLWSRSYYCESCGHISERSVKRYIEAQRTV